MSLGGWDCLECGMHGILCSLTEHQANCKPGGTVQWVSGTSLPLFTRCDCGTSYIGAPPDVCPCGHVFNHVITQETFFTEDELSGLPRGPWSLQRRIRGIWMTLQSNIPSETEACDMLARYRQNNPGKVYRVTPDFPAFS